MQWYLFEPSPQNINTMQWCLFRKPPIGKIRDRYVGPNSLLIRRLWSFKEKATLIFVELG